MMESILDPILWFLMEFITGYFDPDIKQNMAEFL